jgi:flagellar hook-associated protein 2
MTADGNVYLSVNGASPPTAVAVGTDDTPAGVASAINAQASLGVRATVLNSDQGPVLQLVSTKTGTASAFAVTGLNGGQIDRVTASDAKITVGDPNNGGYTITSASNTFSNFIPKVTLTATKVESGITLTVNSDADKVAALVTAANAALTEIGKQTAYTPASSTAVAAKSGALLGDHGVQDMQQRILGTVANGLAGYGSFKQLGIELAQDGTLSFDRPSFVAAYQADPAGVQSAMQTGFAASLNTVATRATDKVTGSLTTAIQGRTDEVQQLSDQIDDWGLRLQARQDTLTHQFTAMELALGKLKDQSNWLAGQIANLPTYSNNSGK